MNAHTNTPADPSSAPIDATAPAEDSNRNLETASEHSAAIVERDRLTVRDPGFFDLSRFSREEILAAIERSRPAREAADREDAGLWALQMAEAALDEEGILDLEAGDELEFSLDGDMSVVTITRGSSR